MRIGKFKEVTIVDAERGKYLVLKNNEESEKLLGRPVKILFNNSSEIPELEEKEL